MSYAELASNLCSDKARLSPDIRQPPSADNVLACLRPDTPCPMQSWPPTSVATKPVCLQTSASLHRLTTSWPASGRKLRVPCRIGLQPLHQHTYKHTQQNHLQYYAHTRALASAVNTSYSILHNTTPNTVHSMPISICQPLAFSTSQHHTSHHAALTLAHTAQSNCQHFTPWPPSIKSIPWACTTLK